MKILIVEDEPDTQLLLATVVQKRGHDVTVCKDAESAWTIYQDESHPLVLLDLILPGMDGLQLCRQIRALPSGDQSIILVVTARDQPQDLQAVLEAGANDYLSKPINLDLINVRLTIAEQQVTDLRKRKQAEARVAQVLVELEQSHDDLLAILNQFQVGIAMTDAQGCLTFLSQTCQALLGGEAQHILGKPWEAVCPFDASSKRQLKAMAGKPPAQRHRVPTHVEMPNGQRYWLEVDVQDDPRETQRKIFVMYDVTEVHDLRRLLGEKARFHDMIGGSEVMQQVFRQIREIASVDTTVLIQGETGTGKELVARAIHNASQRRDGPFITVNCAGLTESLIGSQLFGHRRGAFTGAVSDQQGLFEAANGGTLFLDEIGDIPISTQISLLRALQEREITRLGETRPRKIKVRVLAATHHNLDHDVEQGHFRADLLYRLRVGRIHLPPLRERREDIPLLVGELLNQCRTLTGKAVQEVSQEAMQVLLAHPWPGNVRELKSTLEYAVIHCNSAVIQPGDFPSELSTTPSPTPSAPLPQEPFSDDKQEILDALKRTRGNRARAARLLGIGRTTLYRRLHDLGIS